MDTKMGTRKYLELPNTCLLLKHRIWSRSISDTLSSLIAIANRPMQATQILIARALGIEVRILVFSRKDWLWPTIVIQAIAMKRLLRLLHLSVRQR
jgi:hypothetical protein